MSGGVPHQPSRLEILHDLDEMADQLQDIVDRLRIKAVSMSTGQIRRPSEVREDHEHRHPTE